MKSSYLLDTGHDKAGHTSIRQDNQTLFCQYMPSRTTKALNYLIYNILSISTGLPIECGELKRLYCEQLKLRLLQGHQEVRILSVLSIANNDINLEILHSAYLQ